LALVAAGCGEATEAELDEVFMGSAESSLTTPDPLLNPKAAGVAWRWIGIKSNVQDVCPVGGQPFVTRHLFSPNPVRTVEPNVVAPGLRRYCIYKAPTDYEGNGRIPQELSRLLQPGQPGGEPPLIALEPDRQALSAFGAASLDGVMQEVFAEEFKEHAGRLEMLPLSNPQFIQEPARTRLSFLDSVPSFEPTANPTEQPSTSPHGHGLTNMAKSLVCDEVDNCAADISTQLALPLLNDGGTTVEEPLYGGFFGTIGGLAQAISLEVDTWRRQAYAAQTNDHMVMNLSLGWSPDYGGSSGSFSSWPLDVQAVYSAVEDFVCRGGLIVAAAGNVTNGPSGNSGPILPAAWEQLPAPDRNRCKRLIGRSRQMDLTRSRSRYRPLLYAASGLDYRGRDIAISRDGARTRLAAYADHGVGIDHDGNFTGTLSGTSVSAMVVSSAAAVAWFYRPEKSAHDIMMDVYRGGDYIRKRADFCLGRPSGCPARTRRVTVCGAVRRACRGGAGVHCPAAIARCPGWDRSPADIAALDYGTFDAYSKGYFLEYTATTYTDPVCGAVELANSTGFTVTTTECPESQSYGDGALPFTVPQPEGDPCPNCAAYFGSDTARLYNPYGFSGYSSPTLAVTSNTGTVTNYGLGSLSGTNINLAFGTSVFSGASSVKFTAVKSGTSYSSPLYFGF
jgi:hypothetical protein